MYNILLYILVTAEYIFIHIYLNLYKTISLIISANFCKIPCNLICVMHSCTLERGSDNSGLFADIWFQLVVLFYKYLKMSNREESISFYKLLLSYAKDWI